MAKKALIAKQQRKPKFGVRAYTRCSRCGRSRAVFRKFGLCRICFRDMASPRRAARHHQVELVVLGGADLALMSPRASARVGPRRGAGLSVATPE